MSKINENIGNNLDDNRIIYVSGEFNEEMTKNIYEKLIQLETKNPTKDILMIIDSYGGDCLSFLAIYDLIKMSRCDIATVCVGKAMSCGQMLLMSGTKGKRFASKHSRILVHELSSGSWGKLTELETDIQECREINKIMEKLIKKNTGLNKKQIRTLFEKDSYLSSKEAKDMGFVDYIIKDNKDLYSKIKI